MIQQVIKPEGAVTVRAHAKINLSLRVLAREASGYHSIETLFHRLELADDVALTLKPEGERSVSCSVDAGPQEQNLAFRAAQLYCGTQQWATGFCIDIDKRIPIGGGMGGGSADAAATLLALDALSPRPLGTAALLALSAQLGADVPFLTSGTAMALAWGHGERMLALHALPPRHVALLIPDFGISTVEAYASINASERDSRPLLLTAGDLTTWESVARTAGNDLSRSAAVRHRPAIAAAVRVLTDAGALMAQMTGSGSVVFGIFEQVPDTEALAQASGCRVIMTRSWAKA